MANSLDGGLRRRSILKAVGALGTAAGVVTTLAACGGEPQGGDATGEGGKKPAGADSSAINKDGTIKAGLSYELGTNGYDPMSTSAALTVAANWHTMEGLTEIHPATREVFPGLGADLPKKVDDTTYEVTLRDGAVFSDGSPVTADDVVFSFERVLDEANQSLYASFLPFLEGVKAKGDNAVTVTTKYPFSLVAERLSVVKIVPKKVVEKDAKAFDMNPVGTGPYVMTDNGASSQKVVFERNDKYTGKYPALAKAMEWQILPDDTTRSNALTSKSVQAIDSVQASDLESLSQTAAVAAEEGFGLLFAMFNCASDKMKDVKARQAVLYSFDYEKITKSGMANLATPATCFVQESHPAYKKAKVVYSQDLEKAKKLFAEAGVTETRLLCSDHGWFSKVRPILKENLEAAGLKVHFEEKQSADVYSTIDGKDDSFDIVIAPGDPSVFGVDADLLLQWWYGADVWTNERMHWKDTPEYKQVHDLLQEAAPQEGEEQVKTWQQVFDLISENVPLYPLFHRKSPTAYDPETLSGFQPISVTGLCFLETGSTK